MVLNELSTGEMEARRRALEGSKTREVEERQRLAEEARRRAAEDERRRREREESARRQAEEEARLKAEAESRRRAEEEARRRAPLTAEAAVADDDEPAARPKRSGAAVPVRRIVTPEVAEADEDQGGGGPPSRQADADLRAVFGGRRARAFPLGDAKAPGEFKRAMHQEPREKIVREVVLPETIAIQDLASRMSERAVDVVKFFMKQGQVMKPGDVIDADTAELVASEFGHTVKRVAELDIEEGLFKSDDQAAELVSRPPVVTIMGHVDHGKTSLLDAIRNANVVSGEAGGITQHIGAYQVEKNGQKITFIDTPGHAAFTAMRARGAQATDIAVLVVAADDSVMPQTIESINHAKAARVPIIVAINKIDKPAADPQKVRTQLLQHEVFVESMGGEVLNVEVSATKGTNLDKLLEAILLQAELLDLKANPDRTSEGIVIEAKLDRGRGPVATVLVQNGTLMPGDIIVAGSEWGRVRALVNDRGEQMQEAGPAAPVEVLGLQGTPQAGDRFATVENEARAREITAYRQRLARDKAVARHVGQRGSLEDMMSQLQTSGLKEFPLVVKADVQVRWRPSPRRWTSSAPRRCRPHRRRSRRHHRKRHSLAEMSGAAVIGFNVRANTQARDAAERAGIEICYYNIIYNLVDDVKAAMSGLLLPERRDLHRQCRNPRSVLDHQGRQGGGLPRHRGQGRTRRRRAPIRDNVVIHEGTLKTLKRFKDEVAEVPAGQEWHGLRQL